MMMKPAPASSFKVAESEFLLQFFVITLDNPALLGQTHQIGMVRGGGQGR